MLLLLKKMTIALDRLERVITIVTGMFLGLIAFLVTWQVVARYLLHSGQFWVEELSLVVMMWAALLGAAGCIWTDSHVRVNLLLSCLPPAVRLWVLIFTDGIVLWFAIMMIKEGLFLVQRTMGGQMSAIPIPIGTTYYILPGAAGLMLVFTLVKAAQRIANHYGTEGGLP
jgi:TRAP-type C4-dicarboxylate transport system permease small subunit